MSSIEYCIQKAREIPYTKGRTRVYSCVVTKRGKIVGEGENLYDKSHRLQKHYSVKAGFDPERCYLHSELRSILKAVKTNPKDCKLYVARIDSRGNRLPAYPCPSCQLAIRDAGFITSIEVTV